MPRVPYYFEAAGAYPKIEGSGHETMEGAIQQFLDGIHLILADNYGSNSNPLQGTEAEQATLSSVYVEIEAYGRFYPRFYRDSVPPPDTADSIVSKYKDAATKLFQSYGL